MWTSPAEKEVTDRLQEGEMDIQMMVIATVGFTTAAAIGIVIIFFSSRKR